MSEAVQLALIGSIVPTLTILFAYYKLRQDNATKALEARDAAEKAAIEARVTAEKAAAERAEATRFTTEKIEKVHQQTEVIEKQGNSARAKSDAMIESLQKQLIDMRADMASKAQIAAVLASNSAHTLAAAIAAPAIPFIQPHEPEGQAEVTKILENIDQATSETAVNTRDKR